MAVLRYILSWWWVYPERSTEGAPGSGASTQGKAFKDSTGPDFPLANLELIAVNEWNLDVRPAARAGYQVRGQAVLGAMLCCYRGGLIYLPIKRWGGSARFPVSFHQGGVELLWGVCEGHGPGVRRC